MSVGKIIGFSGKIASGKSTLANKVAQELFGGNYVVVSFAGALKDEVDSIFNAITSAPYGSDLTKLPVFDTVTPTQAQVAVDLVELPLTAGEFTHSRERHSVVRHFLQYWGTEVRRGQDENYWVKKFVEIVRELTSQGINVVSDDMRFENEADALRGIGGCAVRIDVPDHVRQQRLQERDGLGVHLACDHPSETGLDNYTWWDVFYAPTENESVDTTVKALTSAIAEKVSLW